MDTHTKCLSEDGGQESSSSCGEVRTGSPRAGGLAHLRVARCSFSRLKNAHHPLLTPFQGAFAGPIPLTGTVPFAWCAVTFCLVPEVETYNAASDEEVKPVEVEAEGEDSADKADDPPSPPREKVRKADDATVGKRELWYDTKEKNSEND